MAKTIKIENVQNNTKEFYEICSDISIMQKELDQMLSAIEKNSNDFEKGKISKDFFKHNEIKVKKESARIIKNINNLVDKANSLILRIDKDIESQRIAEKKKGKKNRLSEIKGGMKKRGQESTPSETPPSTTSETAPPEQKVEQGS